MNTPTNQSYPRPLIWLHWITVILVLAQFIVGYLMEDLAKGMGIKIFPLHIALGVALLALTVFRIFVRKTNAQNIPEKAEGLSVLEHKAAHGAHMALYTLLVLAPVSGLLAWKIKGPFGEIHETGITLFWILIALHVLAVLKHRIFDHIDLLSRMRF